MTTTPKVLAVIPARSGSRGLPRKNVMPLLGKPLMHYAIGTALETPGIDKVIVSTDDEEFAKVANLGGAETPFLRPPELSGSRVTLIHVMKHALDFYDEQGVHFDAVLSVQATAPLLTSATLAKMLELFRSKEGCTAVATASPIRRGHPWLAKRLVGPNEDEAIDFVELPEGTVRYPRQIRPGAFYFNGCAFLRHRSLLEDPDPPTNALGGRPSVVVIEDEESINIDDMFDFKIAELLQAGRS